MDQPSSISPIRRHSLSERGQSMVELALVAPILIFLVLALMEVGHGINSYLTVVNAARDAARFDAKGGVDDSALLNLIDNETERLPSDLPTAAQNCGSGEGVCITERIISGKTATEVRVCYEHPLLLGSPLFAGPIRMCSTTTMRVADGT